MNSQLPTVLVPELFRNAGGVQTFSRCFISALDSIYQSKVPVISINDQLVDFPPDFARNRSIEACGDATGIARKLKLITATCKTTDSPSILATHPGASSWLAIRALFVRRPFLCVVHGIDVWTLSSLMKFGLSRAEVVLPVSRYTESQVLEQMKDSAPEMKLLPNMVDAETFFPKDPATPWRTRLRIADDAAVLLTICRLAPSEHRKGYDLILEILPRLVDEIPDLVWILGGRGEDLERVKQKAAALGMADHCRFPGFVEDEELPDLYRSADLFVMPSQKEGFGIVFLEAAACGLPVIGGNRDGTVDALADGALGKLIDPENSDELVSAILEILKTPRTPAFDLHRTCIELFGELAFQNRLEAILSESPRLAGSLFPTRHPVK